MNTLKFETVKREISRIAELEDATKSQEEVRSLDKKLKAPKLQWRIKGNYAYCYVMRAKYDRNMKQTRWIRVKNLGKMDKVKYLTHKESIRQMKFEDLKKKLISY